MSNTETTEASGIVLTIQRDGYLILDCWVRSRPSGHTQHTVSADLTYAEALDGLLAHLEYYRPGWSVGESWRQPPLW